MLPGLARGAGRRRLDPRRRRVDPAPSGGPGRRAAADDGGRGRVPRRPPAAAAGRGLGAARRRVPAAGGERPGEVVRADRRAARRGRDRGGRAGRDSRPHRADAGRGRSRGRGHGAAGRAGGHSGPRPADRRAPGRAPGAGADSVPGDFSSAAFHLVARRSCPEAACGSRGSGSTRPGSGCWASSTGWGRRWRSRRTARRRRAARGDRRAPQPSRGNSRPRRGGALAIDELPLVALLGCSPRARPWSAAPGSSGTRSRIGSRRVVEGLRGSGREIEATEDGFVVLGAGGLRGGDAGRRAATIGWRCSAPVARGSPRVTASRSVGHAEAAAVSYPGFAADLRSLLSADMALALTSPNRW